MQSFTLKVQGGPLPNLAEAIVGGAIRGSWWGHPKGKEIFPTARAISENPDVLVCKLVEGKITYVHRRLWPALIKIASRFQKEHAGQNMGRAHSQRGAPIETRTFSKVGTV